MNSNTQQSPAIGSPAELKHGPNWIALITFAAIVAGLAALWYFTPLAKWANPDRMLGWAHEFANRPWAPWLLVAAYTPACLCMFPRPLLTLFGVMAFGATMGFVYAITGISIAALITYFAGTAFKDEAVQRLAGSGFARISNALRKRGLLAMSAIRLVPLAPFFVVSMVAGAMRIKLWHFSLGTLIGMLPGTLAATVFGHQLQAALRNPHDINFWLVGLWGLGLFIAVMAVRRWLLKFA